ncbi:MAG: thioredoxin domain-containing protein [Myxococcales bacterium]|nr:thioredoxin domain-containing protein [Myxococcales bacterium]
MSKGSATIVAIAAFVGGLLIGNLTAGKFGQLGDSDGLDADVQGVENEEGIQRYRVPVTDKQPQKGEEEALVTIVTFSDFQCPFCSRVNPTMEQIFKDYKGQVRMSWRNNPLPFHENAMPAAQLAIEAFEQGGNKKFWKMHDILFQNQRALGRADLERYAKQVGLDMKKVKEALDGNKYKDRIEEDQALATKLGARGTPGFFINGRQLMGAQPYAQFKEVIDDEITRAKSLLSSGVDREDVYSAFMKNALTAHQAEPAPEQAQRPGQPDPSVAYKVPVGNSPIKGPNDALVTIIEVSEFQCPFCKRVGPTIEQIQKAYGSDVRFVFKHNPLPFHPNAMPAAEAASEVRKQLGDKGFWAFHDVLFENQQALERPQLEKYAASLNVGGKRVNMAQFKQAMDKHVHKASIEADQKLAQQFGASGTPSFFINGRNLRGAQPFENFKTVIDEELKKAKAKVAAGIPRAKVYDDILKSAQGDVKAQAPSAARDEPEANKVYTLKPSPKSPRKGPPNAPVKIQMFSEFQCPFCGRVKPTIEQLLAAYKGKIELVWRDFPLPFHDNAMPAAEAAREVLAQGGEKKFWAFHDLLFANQQSLSRSDLEKYAAQVGGIDMARFKKALDNHTHQNAVQADINAVKESGAQIGTPAFFINGKLLQGAQPLDAFKAAVDSALKEKS